MAAKIFVNYRRDDAKSEAARLRDRLAVAFGAANAFMDIDNLLAGERFDLKLQEALAETDVFLAVIGARWMDLLKARTASGEHDYVREEIAAALADGLTVIPVLMDRAPLPRSEELPADIRGLVLHHKHDVAHESFGRDVAALIQSIKARRTRTIPSRSPLSKLFSVASLVAILAALFVAVPRVRVEKPAAVPPKSQDAVQNAARSNEVEDLIREGNKRLREDDVLGARQFYHRAVASGEPTAALAMGRSYDPIYFAPIGNKNAGPDVGEAFDWYRKALDAGAAQTAKVRIENLRHFLNE
jgi:hypothetical protein